MRIHLIATGGSAMHNMALALQENGHQVTGSDDEIYDPARSRLRAAGLLPDEMGWLPERITKEIDAIILGMHARKDNPELLKAQKLGLKIYSYPAFIYEHSKEKIRLVVAGSHGKTTTTAMILHVLNHFNINADFLVGAQLEGFTTMVRLSDAPIIVLEGDEYLSSPLNRVPKIHCYFPQIAIITGIAWDHINVFPTFDNYVEQFEIFAGMIEEKGHLIYYDGDENLQKIVTKKGEKLQTIAYNTPKHKTENYRTNLETVQGDIPLKIFGIHNLQNLEAARLACNQISISDEQFYEAIQSFKGAAKRLQLLAENGHSTVYLDFAHAPSKVKATTSALKEQFPDRRLVACIELHTFSSLNKEFIVQYAGATDKADEVCLYFSQHTLKMKKMPPLSKNEVKKAFQNPDMLVFNDKDELAAHLKSQDWKDANLLLMSSGNFGKMELDYELLIST